MLKQLVQSLADQFAGAMNVRMVYGDAINAEGKTIIPVAKVAGGFGAKAGRQGEDAGEEGESKDSDRGGAGGGFSAKPIGLIEITPDKTRFIPVQKSTNYLWLAGAGGFILGLLLFKRRR